jgi:hypothetical protein
MENKPIEWGWAKAQPSNMRSKEHQAFLIKEYNKNRPEHLQVSDMAELYHKVGKVTIELPKDLPLDQTDEWLEKNAQKWEQELDNQFNTAELEFGTGVLECDGMSYESADRETRYDVNGESFGGHV